MSLQKPPSGPGVTTQQLAPSTGMRVVTCRYLLTHDDTFYVNNASAGLALANTTDWSIMSSQLVTPPTAPPAPNGIEPTRIGLRMPVPCTPSVRFTTTGPTFGQRIALRVTGRNQFGHPIQETTPWVTINTPGGVPAGTCNTYFWLSKVFSMVEKIEYQGQGLNPAQNSIAIGFRFFSDSNPAAVPAGNYINFQNGAAGKALFAIYNQGIGLPIELEPYISNGGGISADRGQFDILGGYGINLANNHRWAINPYFPSAALNKGPTGGFLIGQGDRTANWEGDPNKFVLNRYSGLLEFQRLDAAGAPTIAWGANVELNIWFRTTVGGGPNKQASSYPSGYFVRDPSL